MKKVKFTFLLAFSIVVNVLSGQNIEELKAIKVKKETEIAGLEGQIDSLKAEVAGLASQLNVFPYWEIGGTNVIGIDFSAFNNWFTKANPNSTATTIIGSFNGFAHKIGENYFWRNSVNIGFGWQKLDIDTKVDEPEETDDFVQTIDILNIQSLFGFELTNKLALSVLVDYSTTLLSNFNEPGYFDIGTGITLTPIKELVIVIHPLDLNITFTSSDDLYNSSLGSKFVVDYNKEIVKGVKFRSKFDGFFSYKSVDPSLHNYTWTNGLNFAAIKGIGIGIEYALKKNEQEAAAFGSESSSQNYLIFGLSFTLQKK